MAIIKDVVAYTIDDEVVCSECVIKNHQKQGINRGRCSYNRRT